MSVLQAGPKWPPIGPEVVLPILTHGFEKTAQTQARAGFYLPQYIPVYMDIKAEGRRPDGDLETAPPGRGKGRGETALSRLCTNNSP